jgi:hypothetical protein
MTHHQHATPAPTQGKIMEKATNSMDGVSPTLSMRIGFIQILSAKSVELIHCRAILIPVVTFSQAPVVKNGDGRIAERDLSRLHGSSQIRGEDDFYVIIAAPLAKFCRQAKSFLREPTVVPASGNASIVIFANGMRFKNNRDAHNETFRPIRGNGQRLQILSNDIHTIYFL